MASVLNKPTDMGESRESNLTSMRLSDCNCTICMYILIEPVTMPCGHEMCMSCFKKNVAESSLTCPMCRVRISTWARRAAKNNTLINQERWRAIQEAFPSKVSNRLSGKEDDSSSDEETEVWVNLSKPGEIREEYEKELQRLEKERQKEKQAELEASAKLLSELGDEELQAARRRELELQEQMVADEILARQLQSDMSEPPPAELNNSTADVLRILEERCRSTNSSRGTNSHSGSRMMDKFLAKGKRQMQNHQLASNSPYPYVCESPSEKNNENDHSNDYQSVEDKVLADSLIEIFGRPVSETPHESPAEQEPESEGPEPEGPESEGPESEGPESEGPKEPSNFDAFLVPSAVAISRAIPSTSSKGGKGEITLPPDKPPDVVRVMEDSIAQELVHFRPIHASPKTPPRRLPGGRLVEHKIIRSTPINQAKIVPAKNTEEDEEEKNITESHPGMQSPVMQKRLKELACERRFQVAAQSKSTSTEGAGPATNLDENFWNPKEEKLRNTVKYAAASSAVAPSNFMAPTKPSGKISIQSLFKRKEAAATVASSSANSAQQSVTEDLPDLPDLGVTIISDDDDDDVIEVKAILPLESNVEDEDLLQDAEPMSLSNLSKLISNSEMFDESMATSGYSQSQSSNQLYIVDGTQYSSQSDKDSKSATSKMIAEQGKMLKTPTEPDLTCDSSSKVLDDPSRGSSTNMRPHSDLHSLTTSEILSSASQSSSSTQLSENCADNAGNKVQRQEVDFKVMDESARMAPGDSNSLLYSNLMQMVKPNDLGDNGSNPKVARVPLGHSPSEVKFESSQMSGSGDMEQFTSIKEWFKKWSAPNTTQPASSDSNADVNAPVETAMDPQADVPSVVVLSDANSQKSSSESTVLDDSVPESGSNQMTQIEVSKQNHYSGESLPQDLSASLQQPQDSLDGCSERASSPAVPPVLPDSCITEKVAHVENVQEDVMENPVNADEEISEKRETTVKLSVKARTVKRKPPKRSPRKATVTKGKTKAGATKTKASTVQPQVKRSARQKKVNQRFTRDYVVESPIKFLSTVKRTNKKSDSEVQLTLTDKNPIKQVTVEGVKKDLFEKGSEDHMSKSTADGVEGEIKSNAVSPKNRKQCSKMESSSEKSPVKTPKKVTSVTPQKRTPVKRSKQSQEGEGGSKECDKSPARNTRQSPAVSRSTRGAPSSCVENCSVARRTLVSKIAIGSPRKCASKSESSSLSRPKRSPRKGTVVQQPNCSTEPKVHSPRKKGGPALCCAKNSVVRAVSSPKRKISEVEQPSSPQKKMLRTIKESSCLSFSDEDGCEDGNETKLCEAGGIETDDEGIVRIADKRVKKMPTKTRKTSRLVRSKRNCVKTQVYQEISVDKGTIECTNDFDEVVKPQTFLEKTEKSEKTKVGEDKENEMDEVFIETNLKRPSRGNIKVEAKPEVPHTPPGRDSKFMLEYSPRSCGKKVVINRVARKRKTAQKQLKLSSRGTLDGADDEDFVEEPMKRRKASSTRQNDKLRASAGVKQMTLHDLFGKPKPETSGEKPQKLAARKRRARTSPRKSKSKSKQESPEKPEEQLEDTACAPDEDQDSDDSDDSMSDIEEPRTRADFPSEGEYKSYLEDRDLKMAMQLQAEYEFEAKYKLNCVRRKGSQNSYSFRRK